MDNEKHSMSRTEAERLTEKLRYTATTFVEAREKLTELIREAQEGRAHEALGFRSWTEYVSQVFSDTPLMRLTRDERREIVGDLAAQGMSSRAIAPIVKAGYKTVQRDIDSVGPFGPTEITGSDGKTYRRPTPKPTSIWVEPEHAKPRKPKRVSITDIAKSVGQEIFEVNERIEKIFADDRYIKNEEEIQKILNPYFSLIQKTISK